MKRILFSIISILLFGTILFAVEDVRESARDWAVNLVNVGTNTNNPTPIYAGPIGNLSGRYRIRIENTVSIYDVSLGTFSSFSYANGWVVKSSTSSSGLASIDLPLLAGTTVYGLGQPNTVISSVPVRVMEFK